MIPENIMARCDGACELCGAEASDAIAITPREDVVALCTVCASGEANDGHWRCLQGAVWSEVPAVQVRAVRQLRKLDAAWATETLDMVYLEDDLAAWADDVPLEHRDANGTLLAAGDTVVLIKDLPVKGGGFTAKRGTAVRGISLVSDNAGQIEGRIEGQRIVILTEFVKKK
ncbi:PhnA domain-containing protein [Litoreibacter janthinus]|uniref:Phosphonoacetate hydrolase n=1 Tax=Litoreibacter janthinus TaxID=670154 RepID=A0A1I6G743_9RHOB|nr:alkylphosphonate utilization protein [Litoreibacter janthinus]SFR37970.1 phosphonoacetate hydrolase [Litoreibacter janthinus]